MALDFYQIHLSFPKKRFSVTWFSSLSFKDPSEIIPCMAVDIPHFFKAPLEMILFIALDFVPFF